MPRKRTEPRRRVYLTPDHFQERPELLKKESGLSWPEIARRLGVDPLTVRRWWRYGVRPNPRHIMTLLGLARDLGLGRILTAWDIGNVSSGPNGSGHSSDLLAALDAVAPEACLFYDQFAPEPLEEPLDRTDAPIPVIGNHDDPFTALRESENLWTETLRNGYLLETSHPTYVVYPNNTRVNGHVHRTLIDGRYRGRAAPPASRDLTNARDERESWRAR